MRVRRPGLHLPVGAALREIQFSSELESGLDFRAPIGLAVGPGGHRERDLRAHLRRFGPGQLVQPILGALRQERRELMRIQAGNKTQTKGARRYVQIGAG